MSTFNFVLNSKNVIGQNNNTFVYQFPQGSFSVPAGSDMAISQLTLPYSWFNISAAYGNNSFSYTLMQGTTPTAYTTTITLNDGFYQTSDINAQLQASLKANGFYWYNTSPATGTEDASIIYPISLASVPSLYTNAFSFLFIPPVNPSATGVAGSSITNSVLTFGSAVSLTSGANFFLSGVGVPQGSFITGTGSSTATYSVYQTGGIQVSSTTISYQRNYTYDMLGYGWTWAGGSGTNTGQASSGTSAYTAYITIPQQGGVNISGSTYGIANILGFTNASYPPASQTYTIPATLANSAPLTIYGNSLKTYTYSFGSVAAASPSFAPLGSAVNGVIVRCNLVNNSVSMPSDVLDSFPITSSFGSNINYLPISDNWVSVRAGVYNSLSISLTDQNFNQLLAQDPNVLITLIVRFPSRNV